MVVTMLYNLYNNYYRISNIWDTISKIHEITYNDDNDDNDDNLEKIINLIEKLEGFVIEGGCIYIKFMQWYISNLKAQNCNINDYDEINKLLINRFEYIFNNCESHSLEYSKQIFISDLGLSLDDYVSGLELIASGSIGQVYKGLRNIDNKMIAIKIKHPEIDRQIEEFKQLSNFIVSIQQYDFIRRRYKLNFNFEEFMNDLQLQSDFNVEVSNNNKFKRMYKDNDDIYFPKLYINSENIIVSEYMNIIDINNLGDYGKYKMILNLSCFLYDMILVKNFIHNDLHSKNWGVIQDPVTKKNRLLIMDCALCMSSENVNHNIQLINAIESLGSKNENKVADIIDTLRNFIDIEPENEDIVREMIMTNIVNNGVKTVFILEIVNYLIEKQNMIMNTFIANILLSLILCEEFLKKENLLNCNGGDSSYTNHTKSIYMDMYTFSNKENSYYDLSKYIKKTLNNKVYKATNVLFNKTCNKIKFAPLD